MCAKQMASAAAAAAGDAAAAAAATVAVPKAEELALCVEDMIGELNTCLKITRDFGVRVAKTCMELADIKRQAATIQASTDVAKAIDAAFDSLPAMMKPMTAEQQAAAMNFWIPVIAEAVSKHTFKDAEIEDLCARMEAEAVIGDKATPPAAVASSAAAASMKQPTTIGASAGAAAVAAAAAATASVKHVVPKQSRNVKQESHLHPCYDNDDCFEDDYYVDEHKLRQSGFRKEAE